MLTKPAISLTAAMAMLGLLAVPPPAAQAADAEAIIRALTPKPVTRSLKRGIVVEGGAPQVERPPEINLQISFQYNSSTLTNDGKITLDTLGTALKDKRLADMRFRIVGHTDASGTADYNKDLSLRRAETVKSYLVQFHKVATGSLETAGRGWDELADPSRPHDGVNRRVQIINVGAAVN